MDLENILIEIKKKFDTLLLIYEFEKAYLKFYRVTEKKIFLRVTPLYRATPCP